MRPDTLPAFSDGDLRPKATWTDVTRARWEANRRYMEAAEFGCDVRRLTFMRWLVWNGTVTDDLSVEAGR